MIVLITGTSRGIGRALAETFLDRGATVYGCARSASTLEHPCYRHTELDLADDVGVRRLFRTVGRGGAGLDLVINNAALSHNHLAVLTGGTEAEQIVRTNLLGTFLVNREAIKLMKRVRRGRIVNLSSINVRLASVGSSLYNATKAGVESLCMSLSRECVGDDITINCAAPSLVADSGMVRDLSPVGSGAKTSILTKPDPLELAELVHLIDFFAHPLARNITGQTVYFGGVG